MITDIEATTDFANFIQECDHMSMVSAFYEDASLGADSGHTPGSGFNAVRYNGVLDLIEATSTLNLDGSVDIDADNSAEFLQEEDEVDDFGFHGGILNDSSTTSGDSGEDGVFSGADRREG